MVDKKKYQLNKISTSLDMAERSKLGTGRLRPFRSVSAGLCVRSCRVGELSHIHEYDAGGPCNIVGTAGDL